MAFDCPDNNELLLVVSELFVPKTALLDPLISMLLLPAVILLLVVVRSLLSPNVAFLRPVFSRFDLPTTIEFIELLLTSLLEPNTATV